MSFSLYDATVPQFVQILHAVENLLGKAETYCSETGTDPAEIINARLQTDMHPFTNQVRWTATHSASAIEGMRAGLFAPARSDPPSDFAGLRAAVQTALSDLQKVTAEELDSLANNPMLFKVGDMEIPFIASKFLLSFAQPNFYFHATTAYDILRARGVQIGKLDFLGQLQTAR